MNQYRDETDGDKLVELIGRFEASNGSAYSLEYHGSDLWHLCEDDSSGERRFIIRGNVLDLRKWVSGGVGNQGHREPHDLSREDLAKAWRIPRSGSYLRCIRYMRPKVEQIYYGMGQVYQGSPMGGTTSSCRTRILIEPDDHGMVSAWEFNSIAWRGSGNARLATGLSTKQEIIDVCQPQTFYKEALEEDVIDRCLESARGT